MADLQQQFRADDLLSQAWGNAVRWRDDRAFYVREDAQRLERLEADRYASIDGLAQARALLTRHEAELAAAEATVVKLSAEMRNSRIPFHDGSARACLSDVEEANALAAVQGVLAGLEAANDAGVPASTALIFAAPRLLQMGAR